MQPQKILVPFYSFITRPSGLNLAFSPGLNQLKPSCLKGDCLVMGAGPWLPMVMLHLNPHEGPSEEIEKVLGITRLLYKKED